MKYALNSFFNQSLKSPEYFSQLQLENWNPTFQTNFRDTKKHTQ